jgi:hypothetical protein
MNDPLTAIAGGEVSLPLYDPEDAFVVGGCFALCGQQSVHQGGDPPDDRRIGHGQGKKGNGNGGYGARYRLTKAGVDSVRF